MRGCQPEPLHGKKSGNMAFLAERLGAGLWFLFTSVRARQNAQQPVRGGNEDGDGLSTMHTSLQIVGWHSYASGVILKGSYGPLVITVSTVALQASGGSSILPGSTKSEGLSPSRHL